MDRQFLQIPLSPAALRSSTNEFMFQNNGYQGNTYGGVINPVPNDGTLEGQRGRKRIRVNSDVPMVKDEPQKIFSLPSQLSVMPSPVAADEFEDGFHQRAIRFTHYMEDRWATVYDCNQQLVPQLEMHVVADKGFNYSNTENCFVNQKKNHFQVLFSINQIFQIVLP